MSDDLTTIIPGIQSDIQGITDDAGIYHETHFNARANALDFIDFHIIDRIDGLLSDGPEPTLQTLKQHAENAKHRLEEIDSALFKRLRKQISSGIYNDGAFNTMIGKYVREGATTRVKLAMTISTSLSTGCYLTSLCPKQA